MHSRDGRSGSFGGLFYQMPSKSREIGLLVGQIGDEMSLQQDDSRRYIMLQDSIVVDVKHNSFVRPGGTYFGRCSRFMQTIPVPATRLVGVLPSSSRVMTADSQNLARTLRLCLLQASFQANSEVFAKSSLLQSPCCRRPLICSTSQIGRRFCTSSRSSDNL